MVMPYAGRKVDETTADAPFTAAGHAHPLLGDAHVSVQALALVASGPCWSALPLIIAALAQARRQPSLRFVVSLPPLAILLFAYLTLLPNYLSWTSSCSL